jgi:hypothetical protein
VHAYLYDPAISRTVLTQKERRKHIPLGHWRM